MERILTKKIICIYFSILFLFTVCFVSNNYTPDREESILKEKVHSSPAYSTKGNLKNFYTLGIKTEDNKPELHTNNERDAYSIKEFSYDLNDVSNTISLDNLDSNSVNQIDLDSIEAEAFAFKWSRGDFSWQLTNSENFSTLEKIEISDEIGEEIDFLVSELYPLNKRYLFISNIQDLSDLELHLYSSKGYSESLTVSASTSYNSGIKYSSINIIPRQNWFDGSPAIDINDPRLKPSGGNLTWYPYYYDAQKIIIHHTATPNESDTYKWINIIYEYHANTLGWGDIGYNYLIDMHGNIFEGKLGGDEAKGYHAGASNANSIGISLIGDFTSSYPSQAAQDALTRLIAEKSAFYDFTPSYPSTVMGHRDVAATACPGNTFYPLLPSITSSARSYKDSHFSSIKSTVSQVNGTFANASYDQYKMILLFNSNVSINTLKGLIPFVGDNPADWTGITSYRIDGETVTFDLDYTPYGTQTTHNRLKTLVKIFSLNSNIKAAGLRQKYGVF